MTHISICGSSVDICIRWAQTRRPPLLVSHNWPSVNTVTAGPGSRSTGGTGHPWAPRFDIATCLPAEAPNWEQHGTSGYSPCQAKITPFRLFKKLLTCKNNSKAFAEDVVALCMIFTNLLTFFGKFCNAHMLHASGVYYSYMVSEPNFEFRNVICNFWRQDTCF